MSENPRLGPFWAHFAHFKARTFFFRKSGFVTFPDILKANLKQKIRTNGRKYENFVLTDRRTDWQCWFQKDSRRVLKTIRIRSQCVTTGYLKTSYPYVGMSPYKNHPNQNLENLVFIFITLSILWICWIPLAPTPILEFPAGFEWMQVLFCP